MILSECKNQYDFYAPPSGNILHFEFEINCFWRIGKRNNETIIPHLKALSM